MGHYRKLSVGNSKKISLEKNFGELLSGLGKKFG